MNVQWCQRNNFITSLCFCSWKSSILYSQFNEEKSDCFLSLFLVLQRLVSEPPGRYKNCCLDSGPITGSHSLSTGTHSAISRLRTLRIMHTDDCRLTVNGSCSLKFSSPLGSRFYSKFHTHTPGPIFPPSPLPHWAGPWTGEDSTLKRSWSSKKRRLLGLFLQSRLLGLKQFWAKEEKF